MVRARDPHGSGAPRGADASDPFAAEALRFVDALYRAALRLTRQPSDAEDLVQDTYVRALRFKRQFEPGTNLKAWLYTILHNTWRNSRRQAGRSPIEVDSEVVEQAAAPGEPDTPESALLRATLDADLQAALDGLPAAFREAVWLRDVDEFTYAEIASMLDIPIGTVMSRISRGRRLLHDRLTVGAELAPPEHGPGKPGPYADNG
jgi:RNA polymerase sigma-70 factor (ECF subfamily)